MIDNQNNNFNDKYRDFERFEFANTNIENSLKSLWEDIKNNSSTKPEECDAIVDNLRQNIKSRIDKEESIDKELHIINEQLNKAWYKKDLLKLELEKINGNQTADYIYKNKIQDNKTLRNIAIVLVSVFGGLWLISLCLTIIIWPLIIINLLFFIIAIVAVILIPIASSNIKKTEKAYRLNKLNVDFTKRDSLIQEIDIITNEIKSLKNKRDEKEYEIKKYKSDRIIIAKYIDKISSAKNAVIAIQQRKIELINNLISVLATYANMLDAKTVTDTPIIVSAPINKYEKIEYINENNYKSIEKIVEVEIKETDQLADEYQEEIEQVTINDEVKLFFDEYGKIPHSNAQRISFINNYKLPEKTNSYDELMEAFIKCIDFNNYYYLGKDGRNAAEIKKKDELNEAWISKIQGMYAYVMAKNIHSFDDKRTIKIYDNFIDKLDSAKELGKKRKQQKTIKTLAIGLGSIFTTLAVGAASIFVIINSNLPTKNDVQLVDNDIVAQEIIDNIPSEVITGSEIQEEVETDNVVEPQEIIEEVVQEQTEEQVVEEIVEEPKEVIVVEEKKEVKKEETKPTEKIETKISIPDSFDANYYANNNPDVVAAVGNSPEELYKHYKNYGKKEGRPQNASEAEQLASAKQVDDGKTVANNSNSYEAPASTGGGGNNTTETSSKEATGTKVWKSKTGKKYHKINNCGKMDPKNASLIDIKDATDKFFLEPCDNCW